MSFPSIYSLTARLLSLQQSLKDSLDAAGFDAPSITTKRLILREMSIITLQLDTVAMLKDDQLQDITHRLTERTTTCQQLENALSLERQARDDMAHEKGLHIASLSQMLDEAMLKNEENARKRRLNTNKNSKKSAKNKYAPIWRRVRTTWPSSRPAQATRRKKGRILKEQLCETLGNRISEVAKVFEAEELAKMVLKREDAYDLVRTDVIRDIKKRIPIENGTHIGILGGSSEPKHPCTPVAKLLQKSCFSYTTLRELRKIEALAEILPVAGKVQKFTNELKERCPNFNPIRTRDGWRLPLKIVLWTAAKEGNYWSQGRFDTSRN